MAGRTLGMLRGATPGLTRLAAALGGGQGFQQQGFEAESANQSRMMQALAQAQKAQMEAEMAAAKEAREAEAAAASRAAAAARPGLFLDQTAAATGADRPTVDAVLQRIRTGRLPQMPMAGPTMDGSELTADVQIPQEVQSCIGRALSQVLPLMGNQGDMPVAGWSGLLEKVQEMNLRDDMVGGRVQPGAVARAQNAMAGRAELEIPNNLVGNPYTQQIDMAQPWNAGQAGLVGAQTGAQKANAAQSYASADNSRASAAKTRLEASQVGKPVPAPAAKPLPTGALKMQQEALDAIGVSSSINADLKALEQQIDSGKLSFGPVTNLVSQGRNMAGISSEKSRNFATFRSNMERLRNESLRLNAGVQTDGDAQRAWAELFQNITDTDLVKQRLQEIQRINERGVQLQQLKIDGIRANYGADPLDTSGARQVPPALNGGVVRGADLGGGFRVK